MTDRYCVVGNPIKQSKSPQIHAAFAQQCSQDLDYTAELVDDDQFIDWVTAFFDGGGSGLNVTVPFKTEAFQFADELTPRAELAGAVNTLAMQPSGKVLGDNTDGVGLVSDLKRLNWGIKEKKVLVVGAGGAVRGVLGPLLDELPELLVLVNRTSAKAELLATLFPDNNNIQGGGYELMQDHSFDLVINGTSASLYGQLPPVPKSSFGDDCAVYDMVYSNQPTAFMALAESFGVKHIADGIGMLVGQAAESFYLWRGVRPQIDAVVEQLKQSTD